VGPQEKGVDVSRKRSPINSEGRPFEGVGDDEIIQEWDVLLPHEVSGIPPRWPWFDPRMK
jgi:hypothetical protein